LDDAIGKILDKLEAEGLLENTLIFFASDNGGASYTSATTNGALNAGKMTQFEGGVNIPCIISWKGMMKSGARYKEAVSLMDFYATALAVSEIKEPVDRDIDGVNLIPFLIQEADGPPHEALFWRTDFNKTVRFNHWKFIWNLRDEQEFLFNLEEDKSELNNVAHKHPDLVQQLKKQILLWEQGLKDPAWPGVMEIRFDINGEETWWAI
jgi:arylsulfatase A-like enzyme